MHGICIRKLFVHIDNNICVKKQFRVILRKTNPKWDIQGRKYCTLIIVKMVLGYWLRTSNTVNIQFYIRYIYTENVYKYCFYKSPIYWDTKQCLVWFSYLKSKDISYKQSVNEQLFKQSHPHQALLLNDWSWNFKQEI